MAATGGMRAARTAGIAAATTVTSTPTNERDHDRPAEHDGRRRREVEPDLAEQVEQALTEQDPDPEARSTDATAPTTNASSTTDRTTCPAGRAHRPQQSELPRALRHEDREGVEDDERAHHHADGREAQQRVGEEPEELAHRLADLQRRLRRGEHLVPGTERRLDARSAARGCVTSGSRCT